MRLPYNKAFQSLKIIRLATECCHTTKGDLFRIYFQLSESPPLGWAYIFTTVWRSVTYPMKRQTGVERDTIWIDCIPNEVATCHLRHLEYAIAQTSAIYIQEAQEQGRNAARQAELHAQFRSKLEELSQTLYPEVVPQFQFGSMIAKWLRSIFRRGKQRSESPARHGAVLAPSNDIDDYHHGHFDGAAIAPDGHALWLDYYDHDQGGIRYCFRYVISAYAPPRLVSGYTHENSRLDYEIPFERIPRHVFSEARHWLASHIEAQRDKPIIKSINSLSELLEYLKEHENAT